MIIAPFEMKLALYIEMHLQLLRVIIQKVMIKLNLIRWSDGDFVRQFIIVQM